jgi:hypothetical protein
MRQRRVQTAGNPEFDRFWKNYPRRVARLDALRAWNQLDPSPETVEAILDALDWQVDQAAWIKDGGQFIPYPASWLRAERWTDEPPDALRPRVKVHWSEECAELHGGTCVKQWSHEMRKRDVAV